MTKNMKAALVRYVEHGTVPDQSVLHAFRRAGYVAQSSGKWVATNEGREAAKRIKEKFKQTD